MKQRCQLTRCARAARLMVRYSARFAIVGAACAVVPLAAADEGGEDRQEQIVVVGERVYPVVDTVAPSTEEAVDTAELLKQLPGANLNANGPLSGLAQYRGLSGDRVAVSLDGLSMVTGGPNAMDAPLSYASPLLLEHMSLERGIPSVSSALESLGGHISVDYDRGEHGEGPDWRLAGQAQARYVTNGDLGSGAMRLVGANDRHKLALLAQRDRADDLDFPGGDLTPTRLERDRYDLSYVHRADETRVGVYAGRLETSDSGTPALPMDIRWIDTDLQGADIELELGETALEIALSRSDVSHAMDNFSLRTPPANPMGYRFAHAIADGLSWRIGTRTESESGQWRIGLDGKTAEHTATITNPNAAAFRIENFDRAERDLVGAYVQWNGSRGPYDIEAGLRVNHIEVGAKPVAASIPAMNPMMQMMAANAALLADAFNDADLDRSHTNVDAVVKIGRLVGDGHSVYVELGRKTRAPSYQELYLWLPLESTGGLADGRSYIGNPALDSEVSLEVNAGTSWRRDDAWFAPQIFYKEVSGYIQGEPTSNAVANAVAGMMTGAPALEFTNTDAEIYGFDLAGGYYLSEQLVLEGVLSYTRGRRKDIDDDLYRLAPLNGRLSLTFEAEDWSARIEGVAYAAQEKVAAFNDEKPTSGYGLVNASARWRLRQDVLLTAGVRNLFDRRYRDHLVGYNRVAAADIPVGERLFGTGRSFSLGLRYRW